MRLRLGLIIAVGCCSALQASAASASVGCSASAIRIETSTRTFEPLRANPAFIPCAADAQGEEGLTTSVVGPITVEASGFGARTRGNYGTSCAIFDAQAEARVGAVTVTVGSTTISATGLDATASSVWPCNADIFEVGAESTIGNLTVDGNAVEVADDPADIPIPGVGTLHIEWANTNAGDVVAPGQPATSRALWLEGSGDVPNVVIAEAQACDDTYPHIGPSCG